MELMNHVGRLTNLEVFSFAPIRCLAFATNGGEKKGIIWFFSLVYCMSSWSIFLGVLRFLFGSEIGKKTNLKWFLCFTRVFFRISLEFFYSLFVVALLCVFSMLLNIEYEIEK